jgi:hypothetical protein
MKKTKTCEICFNPRTFGASFGTNLSEDDQEGKKGEQLYGMKVDAGWLVSVFK